MDEQQGDDVLYKYVSVQNELSMKDLCNLEIDHQNRQEEMRLLREHVQGGFPTENQLKNDEKLLKF